MPAFIRREKRKATSPSASAIAPKRKMALLKVGTFALSSVIAFVGSSIIAPTGYSLPEFGSTQSNSSQTRDNSPAVGTEDAMLVTPASLPQTLSVPSRSTAKWEIAANSPPTVIPAEVIKKEPKKKSVQKKAEKATPETKPVGRKVSGKTPAKENKIVPSPAKPTNNQSVQKKKTNKNKASRYSGAPIGGFFVYSSSNQQITQDMLSGIKKTGANTAITFGSRLRPVKVKSYVPQYEGFTSCKENGAGCLKPLYSKYKVGQVFTYDDKEPWNSKSFKCSGERTVKADNGDRFSLIVLGATGQCSGKVNLVVSKHPSNNAGATSLLLDEAAKSKMKVFVGMPAPIADSKIGWLPDASYQKSLQRFTDRFMQNLRAGHSSSPALQGFYHHTEMPLTTSASWKSVRSLYSMQNKAIKKHFPKKQALISPYMDARRSSASATLLGNVQAATRQMSNTANGVSLIIAPQDGQGTGKVGAFSHAQRNNKIDAPSAAVAGKGTYTQVYYGSTQDYMKEVVKGAGKGTTVWTNIELMTATTQGAPQCEGAPLGRGRADIGRVKRQVSLATVPGVKKTIGFMWQPYATCGSQPLSETLRK